MRSIIGLYHPVSIKHLAAYWDGPLFRTLAYSSMALLLACLEGTDSAPFIYFQF